MPEPSTIAVFSVAALALLVVPGPSVLYIVTRSIDQGRSAGLVSVLGVHTGTLAHIGAAAAGISALLVSSAVAFNVVRYAGAAYLVWLGIVRLFKSEDLTPIARGGGRKLTRVYYQGVLVNLLNPKTALFFLAFLPQFIDLARGPAWPQVLVLGLVFVGLGMVSDGAYALVASSLAERLTKSRRFAVVRRFVAGATLVVLGITAALTGERATSSG